MKIELYNGYLGDSQKAMGSDVLSTFIKRCNGRCTNLRVTATRVCYTQNNCKIVSFKQSWQKGFKVVETGGKKIIESSPSEGVEVQQVDSAIGSLLVE